MVRTQAFGLGWQKRPFRPKEKLMFSVQESATSKRASEAPTKHRWLTVDATVPRACSPRAAPDSLVPGMVRSITSGDWELASLHNDEDHRLLTVGGSGEGSQLAPQTVANASGSVEPTDSGAGSQLAPQTVANASGSVEPTDSGAGSLLASPNRR
jgi:hypothetical protein